MSIMNLLKVLQSNACLLTEMVVVMVTGQLSRKHTKRYEVVLRIVRTQTACVSGVVIIQNVTLT